MSSSSDLACSANGRKGLDSVCLDAIIYGLAGPHFNIFCQYSGILHFHPGLLIQNMGMAAGHRGQAHVEIWNHYYLYFLVAPKTWRIRA
jgi:hypothetical protein